MGIGQSAVYRHIRDMDELAVLAAAAVIDDLNAALQRILFDPNVDWEQIDDVDRLCLALVDQAVEHHQAFVVVDHWRYAGGPLGDGICRLVDEGCELIALLLESRWRIEFGSDTPLRAAGSARAPGTRCGHA